MTPREEEILKLKAGIFDLQFEIGKLRIEMDEKIKQLNLLISQEKSGENG